MCKTNLKKYICKSKFELSIKKIQFSNLNKIFLNWNPAARDAFVDLTSLNVDLKVSSPRIQAVLVHGLFIFSVSEWHF